MPPAEPRSLSRSGHRRAVADDTGGDGHVSTSERQDDRSAKDVYSFLTSFTAGVQRGLDESRQHPTSPDAPLPAGPGQAG
jgi:hypothetical protein